ncbi:hypothetical protein MNQ98_13965 [Paenibacillus sp. N3/727]|uniref:hypothetical protein n=1 Tax=Paenibacillus sp. N3/727 TaxID=2925845 RepID=UPI001F537E60|nr:hypothetical protein [Paenibacillus sp. N3/727]UNK21044.1 hypothetical protein MNQ98_13965 [Paenibacillus sp. N3/727]
MILSELWRLYETDKRIQGFSPKTLKASALQHKMLMKELGDLDITEITLTLLKEYLAKQSNRLKPASREDNCRALFVTDTHPSRRMAIPTIRWALKRLAGRGELEVNLYPHRFRHTYACQLSHFGYSAL